jgi:hypothetical protein
METVDLCDPVGRDLRFSSPEVLSCVIRRDCGCVILQTKAIRSFGSSVSSCETIHLHFREDLALQRARNIHWEKYETHTKFW